MTSNSGKDRIAAEPQLALSRSLGGVDGRRTNGASCMNSQLEDSTYSGSQSLSRQIPQLEIKNYVVISITYKFAVLF